MYRLYENRGEPLFVFLDGICYLDVFTFFLQSHAVTYDTYDVVPRI